MATDKNLDFNAAWLREMRHAIGWSTTDTANKARETAREYGDTIKLSQQLVSKFENGHLKSNPRWLAYVQVAMSAFLSERNLPPGRLWELRLPKEIQEYFQERVEWSQDEYRNPVLRDAILFDESLTDDDRDDIASLRQLNPEDRIAVRQIMRSLVNREELRQVLQGLHSQGRISMDEQVAFPSKS